MTVILDATLGGPTSNSYVDMTTAVAIAANIPGGGDWVALDEEIRNLSLIQATRGSKLSTTAATAVLHPNASNGPAPAPNATV